MLYEVVSIPNIEVLVAEQCESEPVSLRTLGPILVIGTAYAAKPSTG